MRSGRFNLWPLILLLFLCAAVSISAAAKTRLRSVTIPIHDSTGRRLLATLKVGEIAQGHQKRGFFRIGALPLVTFHQVSIQLTDICSSQVSPQLPALLQNLARGKKFEIVGLRIRVADGRALAAKRAVLSADGASLLLTDGEFNSTQPIKFSTAVLTISPTIALKLNSSPLPIEL
ncbi:MAG: hypothetical protein SFY81_11755 [Verrucomicrobiota bacterium]|nr:hypothetical protein [Verrucomicrobiota bacterium]